MPPPCSAWIRRSVGSTCDSTRTSRITPNPREAGCASVAPVIRADGELIRWSDFRDFTGVFDGPTVKRDPSGGKRLRLKDVVFDSEQYVAEVKRAGAEAAGSGGP
jgi:hypothetical protein